MKLRFVKFFTSRENEIEKKEEGGRSTALACSTVTQLARSHSPASAPRSCLHHFHSSSLHPAPPARIAPPQLVGRHVSGEQYSPAISSPAVLLLPSLFIKLPKQKSVAVVTWRSTLPADPAVACGRPARLPARAFRQLACPSPSPPSPISRCGPSTAIGAIGKQRPKMRFPVSFPSLTNK